VSILGIGGRWRRPTAGPSGTRDRPVGSARVIGAARCLGLAGCVGTVVLVGLTGCSSAPPRPKPAATAPAPAAASAAPAPRPGGYYLDDGPGDAAPPGLEATPDPVPKLEPLSTLANRPYAVMGSQYVPDVTLRGYRATGIASWYGRRFHGQRTSSGEVYDMYKMTAAHRTLPIPSYLRVTNVANGRSVVVRVNDRGPFLHDRLVDLSYTAALKLGFLGQGSARVEIESVIPADAPVGDAASPPPPVARSAPAPGSASSARSPSGAGSAPRPGSTSAAGLASAPGSALQSAAAAAARSASGAGPAPRPGSAYAAEPAPVPTSASSAGPVSPAGSAPPASSAPAAESAPQMPPSGPTPALTLAQTMPERPAGARVWLQFGAFSALERAQALCTTLAAKLSNGDPMPLVQAAAGLFRVRLGPYRDTAEARRVADRLGAGLGLTPLIGE
jgi:rare lipoprotein A